MVKIPVDPSSFNLSATISAPHLQIFLHFHWILQLINRPNPSTFPFFQQLANIIRDIHQRRLLHLREPPQLIRQRRRQRIRPPQRLERRRRPCPRCLLKIHRHRSDILAAPPPVVRIVDRDDTVRRDHLVEDVRAQRDLLPEPLGRNQRIAPQRRRVALRVIRRRRPRRFRRVRPGQVEPREAVRDPVAQHEHVVRAHEPPAEPVRARVHVRPWGLVELARAPVDVELEDDVAPGDRVVGVAVAVLSDVLEAADQGAEAALGGLDEGVDVRGPQDGGVERGVVDEAVGPREVPAHGVTAGVPPGGAGVGGDVEGLRRGAVVDAADEVLFVVADAGELDDFGGRGVRVVFDEGVIV